MAIVRKPGKTETAASAPQIDKPAVAAKAAPLAQEEAASPVVTPVEVLDAAKAQIDDAQEFVRTFALNGMDSFRAAYDRSRTSAEEAVGSVEQAYGKFNEGVRKLNVKAIDNAQANAVALFDLARGVASASSPSDALSVGSELLSKQADAMKAQFQEYSDLARSMMEEAMAPFGDAVSKSFGIRA